ncbi:TRAP transporter small permease subunit [Vannielia litorea]|uniref:TRAP transporter small permease protein n=1 Tax=Vannielia litorea TaxID=1217970 RepID=A0A1N6IFY8_9RHOB|nr:TRAP transporter small permease [Vannielia litorea]SIO30901.1 TRAP-type C4-dicarboxylate transport system, small permease component [Vannielia litorea]
MQAYVTIMGKVSVFLGKVCGVFYLAAIALSLYEVFMRYVLGAPTSWTSETIMVLVATAWMLCVGAVTQQRRHITVTTMELLLGEKLWGRMKKLAILLSMVGVAGLTVMLWEPMVKVLKAPQTTGSAFDPYTPTYVKTMLVGSAVLYFLQLLANLLTPSTKRHTPAGLGVE